MPISKPVQHLSSSKFDSLSQSNVSLILFLFNDQMINLDNLGISSIESDAFVNYHRPVTTVTLARNFLSHLPKNIFKPFHSTLINLNLQHNRFYSLSNNYFLRCLKQLRTLDLSENQLKDIHKQDFTSLKRLETLILRQNKITYLPSAVFSHCRTITTLDLSDNEITVIDSNAFCSLYRLKTLLLSNNPLGQRSLTNHLMKPLKNLEYFDLENTQLNNLPPYLFMSNQRLRSIKLSRNDFQTTMTNSLQRTFCYANSLIEIDLVGTNIHSLDICTYDQIPLLRHLYLMNNPLHCTCDLFYLKYGDIYRVLVTDGNGMNRLHTDVDKYLDRWISKPELRRHLQKSYARGDFRRLPIDLSVFARCATPEQWFDHEIMNITGLFRQCRQRWFNIERECQNYCQFNRKTRTSATMINRISSGSVQYRIVFIQFSSIVLAVFLYIQFVSIFN